MTWLSIIELVIAALGAGGLVSLFTIKETRKGLKVDNKSKEIDVHIKLIDELQDQVEKQNERLDKKDALMQEKDDIIAELRNKLDSVRTQCSVATLLRCNCISCENRQPPISEAFTGNIDQQLTKYIEDL